MAKTNNILRRTRLQHTGNSYLKTHLTQMLQVSSPGECWFWGTGGAAQWIILRVACNPGVTNVSNGGAGETMDRQEVIF